MTGPETRFKNKLEKYLNSTGSWYIKYWAGSKYTKEGVPDVLACINGVFYGIELKSDTGRPKLLQLVNLRKIREAGGIGVLLYPDNFNGFVSFVKTKNLIWYQENVQMQDLWFERLNK